MFPLTGLQKHGKLPAVAELLSDLEGIATQHQLQLEPYTGYYVADLVLRTLTDLTLVDKISADAQVKSAIRKTSDFGKKLEFSNLSDYAMRSLGDAALLQAGYFPDMFKDREEFSDCVAIGGAAYRGVYESLSTQEMMKGTLAQLGTHFSDVLPILTELRLRGMERWEISDNAFMELRKMNEKWGGNHPLYSRAIEKCQVVVQTPSGLRFQNEGYKERLGHPAISYVDNPDIVLKPSKSIH
jgi:hypothetical protein